MQDSSRSDCRSLQPTCNFEQWFNIEDGGITSYQLVDSTGKASTPTPTGIGSVRTKYRSVTMRGRNYVAPGVPYAMCITANEMICLHGAPWQEDAGQAFGVPRSNGCVRMPTHQARWLFENTPKGTEVLIQV